MAMMSSVTGIAGEMCRWRRQSLLKENLPLRERESEREAVTMTKQMCMYMRCANNIEY